MVSQFETAGPWHSATHKDPLPAGLAARVPNEWQSAALGALLGAWRKNGRASAYGHGEPGSGKSCLAALVAERICRETGSQVALVRGVDLTARGVLVGDFLELSEVRARPHVLVLDEFNTAVNFAEKDDADSGMSTNRGLAANKTSLLATLDWLAEIPNLVVIATGNVPPGVPTSHRPYYRPGRFDLHVEST
jgi:ATP-dependent 26S proteasome regulatory subunit